MAVRNIGTLEAKTHFSALLNRVRAGQRFYITRHGKPLAELRPVPKRQIGPKAGFSRGTFARVSADFDAPLEDFDPYMA
jgi:prevent-host-death family protein